MIFNRAQDKKMPPRRNGAAYHTSDNLPLCMARLFTLLSVGGCPPGSPFRNFDPLQGVRRFVNKRDSNVIALPKPAYELLLSGIYSSNLFKQGWYFFENGRPCDLMDTQLYNRTNPTP
jgi:hypothetical protein